MTPAPKPRAKRKSPRKFSSIKPPTLAQVRAYQAKTRTTIKKRNAKRKKSEFARAYGSEQRVAWVKRQRCIVSGQHSSTVENVHVRGGGGSRKADACWIVPMTAAHHRLLHQQGKRTFEAYYKVDLDKAARWTECRWQSYVAENAGAVSGEGERT